MKTHAADDRKRENLKKKKSIVLYENQMFPKRQFSRFKYLVGNLWRFRNEYCD